MLCIPFYLIPRRRVHLPDPDPDPDPRHTVGIDLGYPLETQFDPKPIPWLEQVGLDLAQQRGLAAMVEVADVAAALPEKLGSEIGAMLNDHMGSLKLADGVSLHLDMMPRKGSCAA